MKKIGVFLFLILMFPNLGFAEKKTLPPDIAEYAEKKHNCFPVPAKIFKNKDLKATKAFVYGYVVGKDIQKRSSFAFWCVGKEGGPYKLIVKTPKTGKADSKNIISCSGIIKSSHSYDIIGELSLKKYEDLHLGFFHYLEDPKFKKGPAGVKMEHFAIDNYEFEGFSRLHYCYKGKWLLLTLH